MDYVYQVIFHPEPEGGFTAIVPSLPGCVSFGKTLIKAQEMVQEAIALYVESLRSHREPVPSDDTAFTSSIRIRSVPSARHRYAAKASPQIA